MKIVVDTNVLISATFWAGASQKIIDKVDSKEIILVISNDIINEFREVLNYDEIKEKVRDKNLEMKRTVEYLSNIAEIITPIEKVNVVVDNPDDNIILECAIGNNIDFIISQGLHLLKIKEFRGIPIMKPDEFLERLNNI